jgi:hypothetical protein
VHYGPFIDEYGPSVVGYSGFNEKGHTFFAKQPTKRTQRRAQSLVAQVTKRLIYVNAFLRSLTMMEEHRRKWNQQAPAPAPEEGPRDKLVGKGIEVAVATPQLTSLPIHTGASKAIREWARQQTPAPAVVVVYLALKMHRPELDLPADLIFRADPLYGNERLPWLDFAEVQYDEVYFGETVRYAECNGFFELGGCFYAVVQELRPTTREPADGGPFRGPGKFPFAAHERRSVLELKRRRDGEPRKVLKFDVVEVAAISNTAYLIPARFGSNGQRGIRFWAVPQNEKWFL